MRLESATSTSLALPNLLVSTPWAPVARLFCNYSHVAGTAGFPTLRKVIVTVVPSHVVTDLDLTILSETVWCMAGREQGAIAVASSDILDDADDADVSYCRSLATTICARCREIGNPSQSSVIVSTVQDLMTG